jgi:hypothetical protein
MYVSLGLRVRRPLECLPLPALLLRAGLFVVIMLFVLVLTRWGYDARTCLLLAAGAGMIAIQVEQGVARPSLSQPFGG